jgi:shikimate kinase
MGSGKTTIGKQVAKLLGLEFHDCDLELERQTGASINLIFDIEGEAGFREREHRMLDELTGKRGVLVATGGGVVGLDENRRLLRTRGFVVYLKTSVEQQLKRLSQDKSRPLLQAQDRSKRLRELAAARNPLYEATADLVFNSRRSNIYASARALVAAIREQLDHLPPEACDANR